MMEKRKILAVDDNSISLATIEQELKKEYDIIPVNSGSRALQFLRREQADLILLDILMAQKDGLETLKEIREMERCKDIPVIMLTSKQDKATVIQSSKLGIYDYVLKPFQGDDLRRRIERVLRENRPAGNVAEGGTGTVDSVAEGSTGPADSVAEGSTEGMSLADMERMMRNR